MDLVEIGEICKRAGIVGKKDFRMWIGIYFCLGLFAGICISIWALT